MRCMTKAAVLADGFVFPEIWPARLRMTLLAGVVDIQARELGSSSIAVHVVAARAIHLAFEKRMRECLLRLATLQLVTVVTNLRLRRRLHDGVARR